MFNLPSYTNFVLVNIMRINWFNLFLTFSRKAEITRQKAVKTREFLYKNKRFAWGHIYDIFSIMKAWVSLNIFLKWLCVNVRFIEASRWDPNIKLWPLISFRKFALFKKIAELLYFILLRTNRLKASLGGGWGLFGSRIFLDQKICLPKMFWFHISSQNS